MQKKTTQPLLSICIPTFNREGPIKNLLYSILECLKPHPELTNQIEIVISDNHSSDNTEETVKPFGKKFKKFIFSKNNENLGYANNINKAVQIASGKYCWLMGSDDSLTQSALSCILKEISQKEPGLIIGSAITNGQKRAFFGKSSFSRQIGTAESIADLIYQSTEISALFAFMSALIIKKELWEKAQLTSLELSHPYTHTIRIFKILTEKTIHLSYLSNPIVSTGSEPNEYNTTLHKHLLLDLTTFDYIFRTITPSSDGIKKHLLKLFTKQYDKKRLIFCRSSASLEEWEKITKYFQNLGLKTDISRRFYDSSFAVFYKKLRAAHHSFKRLKITFKSLIFSTRKSRGVIRNR